MFNQLRQLLKLKLEADGHENVDLSGATNMYDLCAQVELILDVGSPEAMWYVTPLIQKDTVAADELVEGIRQLRRGVASYNKLDDVNKKSIRNLCYRRQGEFAKFLFKETDVMDEFENLEARG